MRFTGFSYLLENYIEIRSYLEFTHHYDYSDEQQMGELIRMFKEKKDEWGKFQGLKFGSDNSIEKLFLPGELFARVEIVFVKLNFQNTS